MPALLLLLLLIISLQQLVDAGPPVVWDMRHRAPERPGTEAVV